ncbi:MAG: glycosyltransferase [Pseudomonadota bacterium]
MLFIVYSQTNDRTIAENMGRPEYSYYFVLKSYLPILSELGEVKIVYDPKSEVDTIYDECRADGKKCVFLHFSAPQNYIEGLRCPTMHVIAWEYSTIPNEAWKDEERENWRVAFSNSVGAITISEYSAEIIRNEMGPAYPVASIPCPVWDGMDQMRQLAPSRKPIKNFTLSFEGIVIDSALADLDITLPSDEELEAVKRQGDANMFIMKQKNEHLNRELKSIDDKKRELQETVAKEWVHISGHIEEARKTFEAREIEISQLKEELHTELVAQLNERRSEKSKTIAGKFRFFWTDLHEFGLKTLATFGFKRAADRQISIAQQEVWSLHRSHHPETDIPALKTYREQARQALKDLSELDSVVSSKSPPPSPDIEPVAKSEDRQETDSVVRNEITIEGVVYTAILNPYDGRKNWQDMVLAFCWAFRETEDATLVLKVSAQHVVQFSDELIFYLQRLAPFKCRVLAIQAYLDSETYDELLDGTTFYVNTSYGEGQSIPLCEALSGGIPAVAPKHTAMRDYVFDDSSVIFETNAELTHWQHDPRRAYRCLHFRPDFTSLVEAYQKSYEIAARNPDAYKSMSEAAMKRLEAHCSFTRTLEDLENFIAKQKSIFDQKAVPLETH